MIILRRIGQTAPSHRARFKDQITDAAKSGLRINKKLLCFFDLLTTQQRMRQRNHHAGLKVSVSEFVEETTRPPELFDALVVRGVTNVQLIAALGAQTSKIAPSDRFTPTVTFAFFGDVESL